VSVFIQVVFIEEPELASAFEPIVAISLKVLVLTSANLVDRIIEVLANVKFVMNNFGLRRISF